MKELVRASPSIEFTQCQTLWNSELQMFVRILVSQGTEHAVSVQTYRVQADSGVIESKLEQIPTHSRVLEHVFKPVSLDSMQ
jgi:hypothetical protein